MRTTLDKVPHCRDLRRFALPKTTYYLQLQLHPKIKNLLLTASLIAIPYFSHSQDIAYKEDFFQQNKEAQLSGGTSQKVYEKDIFGNIVVQDESGRAIGTYKKDIFGNPVFQNN